MSKEIETVADDGSITKETFYTAEEYSAREIELTAAQTALAEMQRVNAARGEDFKAYSKLSEEEKKVYDANTTNLMKQAEMLENKISELSTTISTKDKRDADAAKTHVLSSLHHGDEAAKTLLEEKYALLSAMPETTPQEIQARANEAAKLAGIQIDPRNPLYTSVNGEAPNYKPNSEYVDTPQGKTALDMARAAMNLPVQK